jgi:hypothetical protein
MSQAFSVTAAMVAVGLLASSCHSDRITQDNRVSLGNSSAGTTISVAPGDEIDITLQTIGPGHYETPTVSSGSIRFLGEFPPADPPNPGGPRQLFRFEAVTVGRAEITIPHTLGPLPTPPFAMVVDVR